MKNKKSILAIVIVIIFVTMLIFYTNNKNDKKETSLPAETNIEINNSKPNNENSISSGQKQTPKEYALKAHDFYKKGDYVNALENINRALSLERNDRLLMSLYGIQLALKNYPEAEKAIVSSLSLNSSIPNNWVEYAYFERYYMNASIEKVSGIYEKGLASTKSNINIVIAYASYMQEVGNKTKAVSLWQKAIELYPVNKDVYQAEIDRLSK